MKQKLIGFIAGVQDVMGATAGPVLDFIDNRQIVRRVILAIVVWMLFDVYLWAKNYAMRPDMSGAELSLVIAAMVIPATTLAGFVIKDYRIGRSEEAA